MKGNKSDVFREADPPHGAIGHCVPLLSTPEHLRETLAPAMTHDLRDSALRFTKSTRERSTLAAQTDPRTTGLPGPRSGLTTGARTNGGQHPHLASSFIDTGM